MKKSLIFLIFMILSTSIVFALDYLECPVDFDSDHEILSVTGKGMFLYLKNPEKSPVTREEILDLIDFYFSGGLCNSPVENSRSGSKVIDIANKITQVSFFEASAGSCASGDMNPGECEGKYVCTSEGNMVENCTACGCPVAYECDYQSSKCESTSSQDIVAWWKMDEILEGYNNELLDNGGFDDNSVWETGDWVIENGFVNISYDGMDYNALSQPVDLMKDIRYEVTFTIKEFETDEDGYVKCNICSNQRKTTGTFTEIIIADSTTSQEDVINFSIGTSPLNVTIDDVSVKEESGQVPDYSGNSNHGYVIGDPSVVAGIQMNAMNTETAENAVVCKRSSTLDNLQKLTIMGWFKLDSITGKRNPIVRKGQTNIADINDDGIVDDVDNSIYLIHWLKSYSQPYPKVDINEDGDVDLGDSSIISSNYEKINHTWYVTIRNQSFADTMEKDMKLVFGISGLDKPLLSSNMVFNGSDVGRWHQFATVFDGSETLIYIDGELDNAQQVSGSIPNIEEKLWIASLGSRRFFFDGDIDNLKIYNRGLSAEEINSFYNDIANIPYNGICGPDENVISSDCEPDLGESLFEIVNAIGDSVAVFDSNGNLRLQGECKKMQSCEFIEDSWSFTDSALSPLVRIDNQGNLCVEEGGCLGGDDSCESGSFKLVADKGAVASISETGELCLTGYMMENR